MPRGRTAMHLMKDVLRLHHECGRSQREVARSCGVSVGTVNGLLRKAREAGLGWPLPADLDEQQLHERLYGAVPGSQPRPRRETIDFAAMHKELQRRRHLTVQLLWHAYREECPDGYSYSQYCELYRAWKASRELVMLQPHKPGEKLFVDYCGASVPVYLATGVRQAVVFVAVLGASSYEEALFETSNTRSVQDWFDELWAHCDPLDDLAIDAYAKSRQSNPPPPPPRPAPVLNLAALQLLKGVRDWKSYVAALEQCDGWWSNRRSWSVLADQCSWRETVEVLHDVVSHQD